MSKTYEYLHVVFGTKLRKPTIDNEHKEELLHYLFALLKEMGCYVYRINAMEDHVHIFFDKNKKMIVETIVQKLKGASSAWMRRSGLFPYFEGWAKEYFAGSISSWDKDMIINYIANQPYHHKKMTFEEEMMRIYKSAGVEWHPNDFL